MGVETMTSLDQELKNEIKDIVCEILEIDPDEATETSLFKEDHGADSLIAIDVLAAIERRFNVTIDQEALTRMTDLSAVYTLIEEFNRG